MYPLNKKLSEIFMEMSAIYTFLGDKNPYRAIAYKKAAQIISDLKNDVGSYSEKQLEALKGIGHGIASKIEEYEQSGRIAKYEELKNRALKKGFKLKVSVVDKNQRKD